MSMIKKIFDLGRSGELFRDNGETARDALVTIGILTGSPVVDASGEATALHEAMLSSPVKTIQ